MTVFSLWALMAFLCVGGEKALVSSPLLIRQQSLLDQGLQKGPGIQFQCVCVCVCVWRSPYTNKRFLDVISVSEKPTQFYYSLRRDELVAMCAGLSPQRLPSTSDASPKPKLSPVLLMAGYKSNLPMTTILGSLNLIELLTELKNTSLGLLWWSNV